MLQAETIDKENVSVLVQLLNQIQQTENSQDTTFLLEEIFSLLPSSVQEKLVNSNDISKALQELLMDLENPFSQNCQVKQESPFNGQVKQESPLSLKRKLQRNTSIIQNLEMNLQETRENSFILEKKYKDSVKAIKVLESNLDKEKLRNSEFTRDLQEEVVTLNRKIQKFKDSLKEEEESKINLKIHFSKILKEKQEENTRLEKELEIKLQEINQGKLENSRILKEKIQEKDGFTKEILQMSLKTQVITKDFEEKDAVLQKKIGELENQVETGAKQLEKEQEENNGLYLKNLEQEKEISRLNQDLNSVNSVNLEKEIEIQEKTLKLKELEDEIFRIGLEKEKLDSRLEEKNLKEQDSKKENMEMLKQSRVELDLLNDLYLKEKDSKEYLQENYDLLMQQNSALVEENQKLKTNTESLISQDSQVLQKLKEDVMKEQDSKNENMEMLKQSRVELDLLNDLYLKEKDSSNLLKTELDSLLRERDFLLEENQNLHIKNESLLLNAEIHRKVNIKMDKDIQTTILESKAIGCDSDDLILHITSGNQTQRNTYVDKSFNTVLEAKSIDSKTIQVDLFEVKNIKHSQLQTISIATRDIYVQSNTGHYLEDDLSGMSNFHHDSALEQQFELKFKTLLENTAELEDENTQLKSELHAVQNQVLETRKQLDARKKQDAEITNLISRLKSDISQAEFVASVSHEDVEQNLDAIESLKSKVFLLEEDIAMERNRASLFRKEPLETCTTSTSTLIEVSHRGTMPMEVLPTIDVRLRKSHSKSFLYLIGIVLAIYSASDTERISQLFVCFLTWLDDLFLDKVEVLM